MGLFNLFFGSSEPTTKDEIAEAIAKEEEKLASCESQYIFMKDQYQKHGGSSYGMMRTEQEMARHRAKIAGLQAKLLAKM